MLAGGDGDDLVAAGPGDDGPMYGDAGADKIFGGLGDETFHMDSYFGGNTFHLLYGDRSTFRDTASLHPQLPTLHPLLPSTLRIAECSTRPSTIRQLCLVLLTAAGGDGEDSIYADPGDDAMDDDELNGCEYYSYELNEYYGC